LELKNSFNVQRKDFLEVNFQKRMEKGFPIVLEDVLHVPMLAVNLLSITKCITKQEVQFTANNGNLRNSKIKQYTINRSTSHTMYTLCRNKDKNEEYTKGHIN
jgi:hypothetical protein